MVIDSSALIAILLGEIEAARLVAAMVNDPKRLLSAVSALESAMVVETRKGPLGGRELDLLMHKAGIEIVSMSADQVHLARAAYLKFGKGRHPAGLNLGDCCAYALSKYSGHALLFNGNDFDKTDVTVVPY